MKKIISGIVVLLMMALIVFFVYQNTMLSKSVMGIRPLTVLTNSMQPEFNAGDLIFIREVDVSDIKVGDIITYWLDESKSITHRVIQIVDGEFITKGDNNNVEDEKLVSREQVMGELVFIIPYGGYITSFISSPIGLFLFILLPVTAYACITIYEYIMKHAQELEKTKIS